MKITAAPGIYLVEEIKEPNAVNTGKASTKKLLKGKVIDVGPNRDHDSGGKMESFYKVGDVIRFLNYQEDYDHFDEKDVEGNYHTIYTVLFNDARAKIEKEENDTN